MNLTNKTIWITGASSGIGRAVAIELSNKKVHLILSSRNSSELEKVGLLCKEKGSTFQIIPLDLGNEISINEAATLVFKENTKIDALYHFGGISQRSFVKETPVELDRKIMEINYFGTIALTKLVLPKMIKNGGGQIAATTSIVGKFGFPLRSAYAASKHALHGFFESLYIENKEVGIKVSMIIPGRVQTNISLNALNKEGEKHQQMDEGQEKGLEADKAAKKIIKGLEKNKREILVGKKELFMVPIKKYFPSLFYYLSSRIEKT